MRGRLGQCIYRSDMEKWGHQFEYILTLMGYSVGVGAIWKFPYLCARNGGGSFMLPYTIFVVIGAIPLTYLEMFVGQYSQGGPISAWNICPPLRGMGLGSVLLSWLFAIYYPTFFAWILYYLYYSFFPTLPWTQCGQWWNTPQCVTEEQIHHHTMPVNNATLGSANISEANFTYMYVSSANVTVSSANVISGHLEVSAAEEFFRQNVLQISDSLENMGSPRWPLIGGLLATYVSVYVCLINGIKLSGKIVYVTVLCPYILILVFLVRSCTLPGALDGILFYIVPNFERLLDGNVWMEALGMALYVMGIGYGFQITMAARNPIKNNCLRDAVLTNLVNLLSQYFYGIAVFSITGHVAYKRGVNIDHFQTSGIKLGFITYPEAVSYLPLPQLWSVFLFVMLYTLGIDTLTPSFEVVTTVFAERFPRLAKRRWLLNAVVLIPSCLLALPYLTEGGLYFLTLVEWYAFFPAIVLFALLECIIVGWIYGRERIDKAMMMMWNRHLHPVISLSWRFVCPVLMLVVFGYSLYSYRPPVVEEYTFPTWATWFGWLLSCASVFPIPAFFVWSVHMAPGDSLRHKIKNACTPRKKWADSDYAHEVCNDVATVMESLVDAKI